VNLRFHVVTPSPRVCESTAFVGHSRPSWSHVSKDDQRFHAPDAG
jgi:hypothetical protein